MDPVVKSRTVLCKVRGKKDVKTRYLIEHQGKAYCVLAWAEMKPIVHDIEFDEELSKYVWCWHSASGVAYSVKEDGSWFYMHDLVWKLSGKEGVVAHLVKENRSDNRLCNLVETTGNDPKRMRSDKKPPTQELINAGVKELDRYVVWEQGEHRFVIKEHPKLVADVKEGKMKNARLAGNRKKDMGILEKYEEILKVLHKIDDEFYSEEEKKTIEAKKRMSEEYKIICRVVQE